ncbi:hypothetical protein [Janthinobacterium sp. PC23-8]|uniref:hypothetical protein n=1 Tax=Janthinobacterium sp. PC23-8 TaxID=2012679 RepID=UPI000B96ED77|nr:hypothetical protein [Janthinobacterium sp. PC23-8]OYO29988.1 hypothetical protein CD932_01685 [Janthinobacterium sp. PC23-8]
MHIKTINTAAMLVTVALLAACAGLPGQGAGKPGLQMPGKAPVNDDVAATWYNPPGEFPGICLTQFKDGRLRFDGGFAFFNPGRWSYDADKAQLRLEVRPWPDLASAHAHQSKASNLLRVEADRNMLVYGVKADTPTIGVGGFIFYRDMPCPAGG